MVVASWLEIVFLDLVLCVEFIIIAQTEIPASIWSIKFVKGYSFFRNFETLLLSLYNFGSEFVAIDEQIIALRTTLQTLGSVFEGLLQVILSLCELLEFPFEVDSESLL